MHTSNDSSVRTFASRSMAKLRDDAANATSRQPGSRRSARAARMRAVALPASSFDIDHDGTTSSGRGRSAAVMERRRFGGLGGSSSMTSSESSEPDGESPQLGACMFRRGDTLGSTALLRPRMLPRWRVVLLRWRGSLSSTGRGIFRGEGPRRDRSRRVNADTLPGLWFSSTSDSSAGGVGGRGSGDGSRTRTRARGVISGRASSRGDRRS